MIEHCLQIHHTVLLLLRVLLRHYDQKVDGPYRVINTLSLADQDLRPVIHQVRDQFVRTPVNVKVVCAESRSPKEQLLESLQLSDEAPLSE